jgi:hypothetical protein
VIAVHELAANAVRHGAGGGLLTMRIQAGRLRCRVSEPSLLHGQPALRYGALIFGSYKPK